jgi:ornithine carbamoyltransferase
MKHLLTIHEWPAEEIQKVFEMTKDIKARPQDFAEHLRGRHLAMIFQKSSTRTRVSFEVGMSQLGGKGLFLSSNDLQLGRGETIADTARVLSRYVDIVMLRLFRHTDLREYALHSSVPVINGLDDYVHPCQGLTDYFTILEKFGKLAGLTVTYIGDGNNVCHSLIFGAAKLGVNLRIATPEGYEPLPKVIELSKGDFAKSGGSVTLFHDAREACTDSHVVYTDTWVSMGQEEEKQKRLEMLSPYQVNTNLMALADKDAIFMHCLPAHRNSEVTDEVMDSAASVVFDQAENRMHVQKSIMLMMLK